MCVCARCAQTLLACTAACVFGVLRCSNTSFARSFDRSFVVVQVVAGSLMWKTSRVTRAEAALVSQRQALRTGVAKVSLARTVDEVCSMDEVCSSTLVPAPLSDVYILVFAWPREVIFATHIPIHRPLWSSPSANRFVLDRSAQCLFFILSCVRHDAEGDVHRKHKVQPES